MTPAVTRQFGLSSRGAAHAYLNDEDAMLPKITIETTTRSFEPKNPDELTPQDVLALRGLPSSESIEILVTRHRRAAPATTISEAELDVEGCEKIVYEHCPERQVLAGASGGGDSDACKDRHD